MKAQQGYYNNQIMAEELLVKAQNWPALLASRQLLNLSCPAAEDVITQHAFDQAQKDLNNQRVVHLDVKRTRVAIYDEALMEGTERCLTLFCQKHGLSYKQGINEIMAPFALLNKHASATQWSWLDTYQCFSGFFKKYLLNLYFDEEFNSLQLLFRMIRILLKYHDPALSRYLGDCGPELYATAWFMTLFSNALLVRKATPRSLMLFCLENKVLERCSNYSNVRSVFDHIEKINLFLVFPRELVHHLYRPQEECLLNFPNSCPTANPCYFCKLAKSVSTFGFEPLVQASRPLKQMVELSNDIRAMPSPVRFCILDIRASRKKVLVDSQLLDITQPILKTEEQFLFQHLESRGKVHFVFLFSEFNFEDLTRCDQRELEFCTKFIEILYSSGFQYMSILEGGFLELEKQIRREMQNSEHGGVTEQNGSFIPSPKKLYSGISSKSLGVTDFFDSLNQHQISYIKANGILQPIEIRVTPSLLFTLQRMSLQRSSFVLAGNTILLNTQKFILLFRSCTLLRRIVQFLNNSKSLTEYFLSNFKEHAQLRSPEGVQRITIESIYLIRDLDKITTKPPNIMFLYIKPRNTRCPLYQQHLQRLASHPISYLVSVTPDQLFHIYDQEYYLPADSPSLEKNQTIKKRLDCEGVVGECADNIKAHYDQMSKLYKQHRKEIYRSTRLNT